MRPVRLVTLSPGHFHAALIQKEMHPALDPRVHVYAPLDSDLAAHLGRIAAFNSRAANPTTWQVDVHAGQNWSERFLRDKPGDAAIISGRNRTKIDLIRMAIDAGMHVLADKPWIIEPAELPKLTATMEKAAQSGLVMYDMMTERHEITSMLQRDIIDDLDLFGVVEEGDAANPGVYMESIHYLKKTVAGAPLRRPAWFFDVAEQGEALTDVGTHLVDLVTWLLFTDDPIVNSDDVRILDARRWPTNLDRTQFGAITGQPDFPTELQSWLNGVRLEYFCNNQVVFALRNVHVRLDVLWDFEAPPGGGDTHNAVIRGTRCSAVVRQAGGKQPELLVVPHGNNKQQVRDFLARRVDAWQAVYPGVRFIPVGEEFQIYIPEVYRTGHEAHFAEVVKEFLKYVDEPKSLPDWEVPHLLVKYLTTTAGVAFARRPASSDSRSG